MPIQQRARGRPARGRQRRGTGRCADPHHQHARHDERRGAQRPAEPFEPADEPPAARSASACSTPDHAAPRRIIASISGVPTSAIATPVDSVASRPDANTALSVTSTSRRRAPTAAPARRAAPHTLLASMSRNGVARQPPVATIARAAAAASPRTNSSTDATPANAGISIAAAGRAGRRRAQAPGAREAYGRQAASPRDDGLTGRTITGDSPRQTTHDPA